MHGGDPLGKRMGGYLALLGLLAAGALAQPTPPVRVCAEWEPALGTLISWPLGIPQGLVVELAEDDLLYVLVTGQSAENQARDTFNSWGIDPAHVEYIHTSVETHWPRDWGPHQIFDGNGQWCIVDPIFEGYPWVDTPCVPITSPGGHNGDDAVNIDVAAYFGAPLVTFPAYLTGGNFLVDGHHAAFSTCVMVGENNQLWTEAEFRQHAADYLGVTDYHIVNNTENHGIQHIDCWFKPLDEETLLVKRPPVGHEEYDRIEQNLLQLQAATNVYGRPYRIVRIDCPPYDGYNVAAYTNSLILNKKVFVPLFNIPGDAQAIATFEQALPGYEVIGFPWGSWYYYDALHCRTRAIFDPQMLRMTHRRLDEEVSPAAEHEVEAFIDDRSEAGLIADELRVYWRVAGVPEWAWDHLTPTGQPDMYAGAIPGQPVGTVVEYYVAAADYSGRAETLPRTAPDGFHSFAIIDPGLTIEVADPPTLLEPWTLTTFDTTIDPGDESLVPDTALLHWRYDGGTFHTAPLTLLGGDQYQATLPRALCEDVPEFYVSAEGSNSGVKTAPPGAPAVLFTAQVGQLEQAIVFSERFEGGLPGDWSASGFWHVTEACEISPPCDGNYWAYYGQDGTCNYDNGATNSGVLTSPPITVPTIPPGGEVLLSYCSHLETEDEPGYDIVGLYVNDVLVDTPDESAAWGYRTVDLTSFAGQTVILEWHFDTIDDYYNDYHGWQVDAVLLTASEIVCDFTPSICRGDSNCDGGISWRDIDYFVAGMNDNESAWEAMFLPGYPSCTFANLDVNEDGTVSWRDIDPLVAAMNTTCP